MADPQGIFEFGTIRHVRAANFTQTHGTNPDICTIYAVQQPGPFPRRAPLIIRYGGFRVTFPDCKLDEVNYDVLPTGEQVMAFQILDRRWRWQGFGRISGEYNVRDAQGGIRKNRRKTARELVQLCFEAMAETSADLRQVPKEVFPYVEWDDLPANALQSLLDSLGLTVFINAASNRPTIGRKGVGSQLPANFDVMSDSLSIDPAEVPDQLVFAAAKTLWQIPFELEAVLPEAGTNIWKPLDSISYKPKGGLNWKYEVPPEYPNVDRKHLETVKKYLWRAYRIKLPQTVNGVKLDDLQRVLPLEDRLVETQKTDSPRGSAREGNFEERKPFRVYGDFYAVSNEDQVEVATERTLHGKRAIWSRGASLDRETGIVLMNEPCYRLTDKAGKDVSKADKADPDFRLLAAAKLWLETATGFRDPETYAWIREEVTFIPPGQKQGTAPFYIARDDVQRTLYRAFTRAGASIKDNREEVHSEALFYLEQALLNFQTKAPGTRSYAGFQAAVLDGAIAQITYGLAESGAATTTISRNQEQVQQVLTFKEMRERQHLRRMIEREAKRSTRRVRGLT